MQSARSDSRGASAARAIFWIAICITCQLAAPHTGAAEDPPQIQEVNTLAEQKEYEAEIAQLVIDRNWDELESRVERLRRERPLFPTGLSRLRVFYRGVSAPRGERNEDAFAKHISLLEEWRAAKPESLAATIALGEAYTNFASAAAEGAPATTSSEVWRQHSRRLQRAARILHQADKLPGTDPERYRAWVAVGVGLGFTDDEMYELLRESLKVDPTYASTLAGVTLYFLPSYYGNAESVSKLGREVVRLAPEPHKDLLYATMVTEVWLKYRNAAFHTFELDWNRARRGFEAKLQQFPDSIQVLNEFCAVACAAGDRETARRLFERLEGRCSQGLWPDRESFLTRYRWAQTDVTDGDQRQVVHYHRGPVLCVAYSRDGRLASGGEDCCVTIHPREGSDEAPRVLLHDSAVHTVALSPRGRWLASGEESGMIWLWDRGNNQRTSFGRHDGKVTALAFSADDQLLASSGNDGAVRLWRIDEPGIPIVLLPPSEDRAITAAAFSPDASRLVVVDSTGALRAWDVPRTSPVWTVQAGTKSTSVAFSPDGRTIATGGEGGRIGIWDASDGSPQGTLSVAVERVGHITFTPDGRHLIGAVSRGDASAAAELQIWQLAEGDRITRLAGHKAAITGIATSPDQSTIATAGRDLTVRLWDLPAAVRTPD